VPDIVAVVEGKLRDAQPLLDQNRKLPVPLAAC
jgi:hypothetical protein